MISNKKCGLLPGLGKGPSVFDEKNGGKDCVGKCWDNRLNRLLFHLGGEEGRSSSFRPSTSVLLPEKRKENTVRGEGRNR